ncbi:unnamed protein product [Paramecium octaurelia]|uniref:Uncharacterized protein n=1 Tax=Paramecium octaurelia TaxID=43137 RepID=A0A8S1TZW6_PAROT|nr:unnamed protein product [Paramecium octaurelia]
MLMYFNRMNFQLKVIKENQLTNKCDINIQLTIPLHAHKYDNQIDFTTEHNKLVTHVQIQKQIFKDHIEEFVNKSFFTFIIVAE